MKSFPINAIVILMLLLIVACEKKLDSPTAEQAIISSIFRGNSEIRDKLFSMQYYDHTIYKDIYIDSYQKLAEEGVITYDYQEGFFGYLSVSFTDKGLQYKASEPVHDEYDAFGNNKRVKVVASIKRFGGVTQLQHTGKNAYQATYRVSIIATPFGKYLRTAPIFTEKPIRDSSYTTSCTVYYDKQTKHWLAL